MKDKLTKHHKSVKYFVFRKIIIISCIALLVGASIAIPVTISAMRAQSQLRIIQ